MTTSSAVPAFRYFAYLSYSHQDKTWADWLHKALETYAVPKRLVGRVTTAGVIPRRLIPIFRDRDELASAHDLSDKVNQALAQSANLIVICSPRSAQSRWVNEEVLAFERQRRSARVFCLIVAGEPNASELPGREADECFAPALRFELDAEGQLGAQRTEPIAADARPGKDGKANAKLKLIAGMLEVGFDTLKRRELQRRARRLTVIAALAVLVMSLTTVLAIAALISRHRAVIARQMAVAAQQTAVRRQKQAEDLVSFMLGDLNDKLVEVHRLDILRAVDDKAMAYFAALPSADVSDAGLAESVTALEKIGDVRMEQGRAPAALDAFRAAVALAAELVRRAPGDTAREVAYADALNWVGQTYWREGDLEHVLQNFKTASGLLQHALALHPGNTGIAFDLASALSNTGQVLESRGDLTGAKAHYEAALRLFDSLAAKQPSNRNWQSNLGFALDSLGKLAVENGQLDQALVAYRRDQHIKAVLAALDPNNHDAQENLLVADAILGRTLGWCGHATPALRYTGQAVERARALLAFDHTVADWQDYFALYSQQLGGLLRQRGQWEAAATADSDAVRVLSALVSRNPTEGDLQQDLAQSRLERARLQLAQGDGNGAESSAQAGLTAIQALRAKDPADRALILLAAQAFTVLGQIATRRRDASAAHVDWLHSRDTVAPAAQVGDDPNFLAAWASVLLWQNETEAARPVIARLANTGYRAPDFLALVASKGLTYPLDPAVARRITQAMSGSEQPR